MARPTTRLKRRARRLSRWSALRVRMLVALVVAAGLTGAVASQATANANANAEATPRAESAAPAAPAPRAAAPRTWIIDAREDAPMPGDGPPMQGWVIRETGLNNAHHPLTITVGDTVEWHFESVNQYHDLLSQNTFATWMPKLTGGGGIGDPAVSYTFTAPGTYDYICNNHQPLMSGQIIVQPAGSGGTNQPPTVAPMASPQEGPAPLAVFFMAHGHDADGDALSYLWDFGTDPGASDQSTEENPQLAHVYQQPGSYTATVTVTDARGASAQGTLAITVTGDSGGEDGDVLEVDASATPTTGNAPLTVTFDADVTLAPEATTADLTTAGEIRAFAHGLTAYPTITGNATMVRRADQTTTTIALTGLKPNAAHDVHVHEQTCADGNAGAHYRFDTTQPFAAANEIWLPFTSNPTGASGTIEVTKPRRAGNQAVSIVIHDPDTPSLRIACVDLAPALTYDWDFGDGSTGTGARPSHTYTSPGSRVATVTATHGPFSATDTVEIQALAAEPVLQVSASATPTTGTAPLTVGFDAAVVLDPDTTGSTVTTEGDIRAFAHGLTAYPTITGNATMVRRADQTTTTIALTGLKPNAAHDVHVHEQTCADGNAGAHYRFDTTQPFAAANEIWLPFTSNPTGASGTIEVTKPRRAGNQAVSIVIHDPDTPSLRIACVDLAPALAWDFGDGSTGTGPRPTHTYRAPGSYTATVTARATSTSTATASVQVVVRAGAAPQTTIVSGPSGHVRAKRAVFRLASSGAGSRFQCRLDAAAWKSCSASTTVGGLKEGRHTMRVRATDGAGGTDASPAVRRWVVDRTGPTVRATKPAGTTRDRTPTIRAKIADRFSAAADVRVVLRLDGLKAPARHVGGAVTYTPRRALAPGRHVVRLVAVDRAGNRTIRVWRFTVRR